MKNKADLSRFNIEGTVQGKKIIINEQTTIAELDQAIYLIHQALADDKNELRHLLAQIEEFMRQHHAFDVYLNAFGTKG